MKKELKIKNGTVIPDHEIKITASRAGGPGGQHVNKANTRITVHWNIYTTNALTPTQKELALKNLLGKLTQEGDLIVNSATSRSQQQNKEDALSKLAKIIRKALYIPKKRIATKVPKIMKEIRLNEKKKHSIKKKMRQVKIDS